MKQLLPTTPTPKILFRDFRGRGFTLIEMLVAIAVLSLMMTLASRMFFDAQRIVSGGAQTSQIIAHARTLSDQLLKDHRNMNVFESGLGANDPGFLVIVQQSFPHVKFPDLDKGGIAPEDWLEDADGDGTEEFGINSDDWMRSDQIAFFRDAKGLESITPGQNDRFDSLAKARHARVWYGHVWPADVPRTATTAPGNADYNLSHQLTLGRQALLLVENDLSTTYPGGKSGDIATPGGVPGRVASPGGAPVDALLGITLEGTYDVLDLNNFVREDTSSIPQNYRVYDDGGSLATLPTKRALFGSPGWPESGAAVVPANPSYLDSILAVATPAGLGPVDKWASASERLTNAAYATAALEWTFARNGTRLAAATALPEDFSGGMFTAKDIGQLHGSFIPHVADFAIEFAADFIDDFGPDANGNIVHISTLGVTTDGVPDGRPDVDDNGNIKWYTAFTPNPDNNNDGFGDTDPTKPITWLAPNQIAAFTGIPVTDPKIANPFRRPLLTIPGYAGTPGVAFVFSHSGDDPETDEDSETAGNYNDVTEGAGKYWPYMIRYRFRLMDGRGKYRSSHPVTDQPVAGRWFEQIVSVPRPVGIY